MGGPSPTGTYEGNNNSVGGGPTGTTVGRFRGNNNKEVVAGVKTGRGQRSSSAGRKTPTGTTMSGRVGKGSATTKERAPPAAPSGAAGGGSPTAKKSQSGTAQKRGIPQKRGNKRGAQNGAALAAPTQTHAHANEFALSGTNGTAPSQVLATPSGDAGGSRSLTHKIWETLGLKPCYRTSLAPTKAPTSDPPPLPPPTVVEGSNKHRRKLFQQTAGGSREWPFKAFQKGSYKPKRFFPDN